MKIRFKYPPLQLILFCLLAVGMLACENSILNPEKTKLTKSNLYEIMKEWYLWYDTIPNVNPEAYPSLQSLLNAITAKPIDRWSEVMSTEDYNNLYEHSEYIGHGFGLVDDQEGKLWVGFVYDGAIAAAEGVERGWQVIRINGVTITPETKLDTLLGKNETGIENTFQFRDKQGGSRSMTLAKEIIDINSVLYSDIIDVAGVKTGYLVYQHFLIGSTDELDAVFAQFQENNVKEVIVDLRYNPGGQVNVAQHLASLIAGTKAIKGTFVKLTYNNKKTERNISKPYLDLENTLTTTPERVFFICTGKTASSSEALINGLTPYLDVLIVGDDTYGKPVGSITFSFIDSTIIPVTFNMTNRWDEGDFYNGIPADSYIEEDIKIDFGNPEEKMLKEVLYYIENEEWTGSGGKKSDRTYWLRMKGIKSQTGAI